MFNLLKLRYLAVILLLVGCGTPPKHDTQGVDLDKQKFSSGSVVLSCSTTGCAWTFEGKRRLMLSLHQSRQWEQLATAVIALGYDYDLSYFYLGQAAEGIGKPVAALEYYRLSLASQSKCSGAVNGCDNFVLTTLVPSRIRQLETEAAEEAEGRARMRERAAASRAPPSYRYTVTVSGAAEGSTKYSGPNVGTSGRTLLLRGWRASNGASLYQLYVADNYFGIIRNYSSSVDSKGATLRFTPAAIDSRNCKGTKCQHTEHIAITLPRSYLVENRTTGIELSLKHEGGSRRVTLDSVYLEDFLAQTP